jgi:aminoglycoside phosphotransferase (APT) family kinase protein
MDVSPPLDTAAAVRRGEELDLAALAAYLRRHLPAAGLEVADDAELVVEQFPSGWSNLTYLLRFGRHELVLRRPPFGDLAASAHDMSREHRVLAALAPVWPRAPKPYLLCDDPSVLGAPFFVMQRVRGVILRRDTPAGLELSAARARRLSEALVDGLAKLHRVDWRAAGLAGLGRPEGYARRQVEGWVGRYRRARTDDHPDLESAARRLADAVPPESATTLVHNDWKYDNLVLDPTFFAPGNGDRAAGDDPIRAVLDWEMATLGDPLFDLGTTLGYWVEAADPPALRAFALGPTAAAGSLTRRQLAERYAAKTGADLGRLAWYHAFGLFKIAVIVQQIYARWRAGQTTDPRFAGLDQAVAMFGRAAAAALDADAGPG